VTPLLELRQLHKRFPGVQALAGAQLCVMPGEVHALLGENGAGKSTLLHILAGVHQPDEHEGSLIAMNGTRVRIENERAAQSLGIAIVYQERSLFPALSIADNIFPGRQPLGVLGLVSSSRLLQEATAILRSLNIDLDPRRLVETLSPAQQQMVELAKALSLEPKLLLLDEPTAALTKQETDTLFALVRSLSARGIGIVYISHRLEEVFALASRATVMKDGAWQGTYDLCDTSMDQLVAAMIGRQLAPTPHRQAVERATTSAVLQVRGLSDPPRAWSLLRNIDFSVYAGEVLAFAGLAGSGRTELALALFGARPRGEGEVLINGQQVVVTSPKDAVMHGVGYLSEDRKELGLFLEMDLTENVVAVGSFADASFLVDRDQDEESAFGFSKLLSIKSASPSAPVRLMSGGNQQKVALAKWLLLKPKVLIVDEPSRGVDIGARAEMHAALFEIAANGTAVVVISSDLSEVLALGDRIAVMRQGRIVAHLRREEASEEAIIRYATGAAA
jgi:ribose transport system ATP-binding protein